MRTLPIGLAVALVLFSAAEARAADAKAFDLKCGEDLYRVDLARKLWCEGACEEARPIRHADGRFITLTMMEHFALTYDTRKRVMTSAFDPIGIDDRDDARCRVMKFSGLPPKDRAPPRE